MLKRLIMWLIIFAIMLFLFGFLLGVFINLQHLVELCGAAATTTTTTTTGHSYTNPECTNTASSLIQPELEYISLYS